MTIDIVDRGWEVLHFTPMSSPLTKETTHPQLLATAFGFNHLKPPMPGPESHDKQTPSKIAACTQPSAA